MSKKNVEEFESALQKLNGRSPAHEEDVAWVNRDTNIDYPKLDLVAMRKSLTARISLDSITFLCECGVGSRCGNKIRWMISVMECKESRNKLINLRNSLCLKDNAHGCHKEITLSRVMACFPEITVSILHHSNPTTILPYEELKAIHAEFPAIARAESGASVLPRALKQQEKHLALALFLVSSLKKSEIINANAKCKKWIDTDRKENAKVGFGYVKRFIDSEVLSDEMRNEISLEYGIVTSVGTELVLSTAWEAAGACAATWLKSNYDFDMTEYEEQNITITEG